MNGRRPDISINETENPRVTSIPAASTNNHPPSETDSSYAVVRLLITLVLMVIGASGMYVVAVVLPAVQAESCVWRGVASMSYCLSIIGFGIGGMLMGKLADGSRSSTRCK